MFLPFLFFATLSGLLGGALASFLGVVSSRRGTGEGINGRSHCVCGRQLRWWEMIPVFGFLLTGGKDRSCGSRIPRVYFMGELLSFITGFLAGWNCASVLFAGGEPVLLVVASVGLGLALLAAFSLAAPRPVDDAEESIYGA